MSSLRERLEGLVGKRVRVHLEVGHDRTVPREGRVVGPPVRQRDLFTPEKESRHLFAFHLDGRELAGELRLEDVASVEELEG